MAFGPVSFISLDVADMSVPGAPSLSAVQLSNVAIEVKSTVPTQNSSGGTLSGLAQMIVVMAAPADGSNPFATVDGAVLESTAVAAGGQVKIQDLTDADAGGQFTFNFSVIAPGRKHWIAAVVGDNS